MEAGFSLLETLFALAIMSLASVALFQSTSSMLRLSERAVAAGERTVNGGLDRIALSNLVESITPAWPEAEDDVFSGTAQSFRGLTAGAPRAGLARLTRFEMRLEDAGPNSKVLMYYPQGEGVFESRKNAPNGWMMKAGFPKGATFHYRGVDQKDYPFWPPKEKPSRGYFDNDDMLLKTPPLPEAISLKSAQGAVLWTAAISRARALPPRLDPDFGI